MKRLNTRAVMVGSLQIGGQNKVVIQSMTNTKTKDVKATVKQINELTELGCELVRVACLDHEDAKAIAEIKKHISIPISADIHFDHKLALTAIESNVDKIRINPGNIPNKEDVAKIVEKCKEKKIPIRIGVNGGSLDKEMIAKWGYTPKCMVESARKHIEILEELDFKDIIVSLKSSDIFFVDESNRLFSEEFNYPIHLGITEAGDKFRGTIKSVAGLSGLIKDGLGDTVRISLSGSPLEEIKVAKELLKTYNLSNGVNLVSCPTCGRTDYDMMNIMEQVEPHIAKINKNITVAIMGCVVNGPGEASHADIGIAGGKDGGILFKHGKVIRTLKQEEIADVLIEEIKKMV